MVLFQIVLYRKIEEIANRKSQRSKKSDHFHHHLSKKIKNHQSIEIEIEIDKKIEQMIGIDNVIIKGKGIKRKIRTEEIEIVKKEEEVNSVIEVELKIMKKTVKNKSNKLKSSHK